MAKPNYKLWALRTARKEAVCAKPGCSAIIKPGTLIRHQGAQRIHARHVRA